MNIYNYDATTLEYISTEECEYDPIDSLPMIPANATDVDILGTVGDSEVQIFKDGTWNIIVDYRGIIYNTSTKEMDEMADLGELPEGYTNIKPDENDVWNDTNNSWEFDLIVMKASKKKEIKLEFQKVLVSGILINNIPTRLAPLDLYQISLLLQLSDKNIGIIDNDSDYVEITHLELISYYDTAVARYHTEYNKMASLIKEISNSADETAILSIVW